MDLVETLDQLSIGYMNNFSQQFTYDATEKLSFYANGGYYWRMTDRPAKRDGMTGGNDYNTHYEGYNWGTGAKYRIYKIFFIGLDYVGNNLTSRYKYMRQPVITSRLTTHSPTEVSLRELKRYLRFHHQQYHVFDRKAISSSMPM